MSPQAVTETLYALAVADASPTRFVSTEVRLVTTREGAHRARLALLSDQPGWFHRLRREHGLPEIAFGDAQIHVLSNAAGAPLDDIRTPQDNLRCADAITDLVRDITADADCALHVSIAGGRKTMGFYLDYAAVRWRPLADLIYRVNFDPTAFMELLRQWWPVVRAHDVACDPRRRRRAGQGRGTVAAGAAELLAALWRQGKLDA